jgi:thiol:disulfide interchange protein DsbA
MDWVTAQGIDAKTFSDAYSSFGVMSKVKRADQLAQAAKIRGVPALVVDGRYLVVGQNVKSHAEMLALTDKIIDKRRAERNKK